MRPLAELTAGDPAWDQVTGLIAQSPVPVQVLAPDQAQCEASLRQLQVTVRSALGAVALNTGGMLVDHGWLRVYGGSGEPGRMPGLPEVNDFPAEPAPGGAPPARAGDRARRARRSLRPEPRHLARLRAARRAGRGHLLRAGLQAWEPMEGGYGTWITWMLSGKLSRFYQSLRWPGWEAQATALSPRQGLSVIPFLWTREARNDLAATSRRPAAMQELLSLHHELHRQLTTDPDPGFLGTIARPAGTPA